MLTRESEKSLEQMVDNAAEFTETNAQFENTPTSIAQVIRERIEVGTYKRGIRIPTRTQLAKEFGVPLHVINTTVKILKEGGNVSTFYGAGTYVTPENRTILLKHEMIANTIRQRIIDGEYEPFQRPYNKDLTREFQVQPWTMTQALKILRGEGYIIGDNNSVYVYGGEHGPQNITRLHEIIAYKIRTRIERGLYKPGEKMPSIVDFIQDSELGGSYVTTIKALKILKGEGLIESVKTRGYFVSTNYGKN